MVIRAHRCLIGEGDRGAQFRGLGADGRIVLGCPALYRLGVLLVGPKGRALWGQADRAQQSTDTDCQSTTPNSRRINSRTISRVHKENSNCNCRGLVPTINAYNFLSCAPESLGGRPGTGLARSASTPPSRHFANQANTVERRIPSDFATSSG